MSTQKTIYSSEKEIAEIWKLFRETREQMKETDRKMRKSKEETDRQMRETDRRLKETERILKESGRDTDRRLKKLDYMFTGHWGKLIEALTTGGLKSSLKERNIEVTGIASNVEKTHKGERREFDIVATNGEELVAVEVKTTLKLWQVREFLEKVKNFKDYFPEYRDKKVYGAVAYLKCNEGADKYSEKQGLFILNPVGNVVKVMNAPNFRPKEMA